MRNPTVSDTESVYVITKIRYSDVIMSAMASQITSVSIAWSTVCLGVDQRKHQSSTSLAFARGIHGWSVVSHHEGPVTRRMFPFDDVIMQWVICVMCLFTVKLCNTLCVGTTWPSAAPLKILAMKKLLGFFLRISSASKILTITV